MAGGGEEPRLADIGLFGRGAGLGYFAVDTGQFAGALGDPQFQRLVRLFQRHVGGTRWVMSV